MTTQPQAPPPQTVGEYTLLARLGEGGMGIVHLARGADGVRVALKVLRHHVVGDDEARARLAREVSSLERIRSPWVAEVLDADPWAEIPYLATRYVPGLSLHDHVAEEGPVTGRDLVWLAGCLAEGMHAVHEAEVLHRDIKPSNVLMEGRTPILIDFGLARVADDPRLTHTGFLIGTPGYLPPEILYGDDATPSSDLHSWAATVAYAALGRPPFGRGPVMAIMDRVRRGQHDLSGFSGPLADVVAGALAPEPDDRPTPEEVLAWLRPQTTRPHAPPVASPVAADDPFTIPLAVAGPPPAPPLAPPLPAPTRVYSRPGAGVVPPPPAAAVRPPAPPTLAGRPTGFDPGPPPAGRPLAGPVPPAALAEWERAWDDGLVVPTPAPTVLQRVRRAGLVLAAGLVVASSAAAAPWVTLLVVLGLVWLVRSGSLAATSAAGRRQVRGAKWYDGPRTAAAGPWHLLQSLPATALLALWVTALALSAGLLAWAAGLRLPGTLAVAGAALALSTWTGPGSTRVRGPVNRLAVPLARRSVAWSIAVLVLLVVAATTWFAAGDGASWWPTEHRPGFLTRR